MLKYTFFTMFILLLVPVCLAGYTMVSGNVSGQTWDAGIYVFTSNLTVDSGSTLTIMGGVIIKSQNAKIVCNGNIICNGSAETPIVFTSWYDDAHGGDTNGDGASSAPAPNQWGGVKCGYNAANAQFAYTDFWYGAYYTGWELYVQNGDNCIIDHCSFRQSMNYGLQIAGGNPHITNSTFASNVLDGAYLANTGTATVFDNNLATGNNRYGAYFANSRIGDFQNNTLYGNLVNAICFEGCTLAADTSFPFSYNPLFLNNLTVPAGITLTLQPGMIMKFLYGRLVVAGTLLAEGTEAQPIIFTSWYDDAHGGDNNGDGAGSAPAPNQWGGVQMDSAQTGPRFSHCQFLYGAHFTGYNLLVYNCPAGYISNCSFAWSMGNGLQIYNSSASVSGCSFSNNVYDGAAFSYTGSSMEFHDNSFTDNGRHAASFSQCLVMSTSGNTLSGNHYNCFKYESCSLGENQSWGNEIIRLISGSFTVSSGKALTLEPGVVLKFDQGAFTVYGTLWAEGTQTQPIVFTSWFDDVHGGDTNGDGAATTPGPNQWQGVRLDSADTGARFSHCQFLYAAYCTGYNLMVYSCPAGYISDCTFAWSMGNGLQIYNSPASVSGCLFANNVLDGATFTYTGSALTLNNNTFANNGRYAAYFSQCQIMSTSGNTFSGNHVNAMLYDRCALGENQTWDPEPSRMFYGTFTVGAGKTLSLSPGTILKFLEGSLSVSGTLNANGTQAQPIVFTSSYDDARGGDTNGDGSATAPGPNQWGGVSLNNSETGPRFSYCQFYYGAYFTGYMLNIQDAPAGYVEHCTFRQSMNYGVQIVNSSPVMRYNDIRDNISAGVCITGNSHPDLGRLGDWGHNIIMDNLYNWQLINNSSSEIYAMGNAWGANTLAAIDALIYDNDENPSCGTVFCDNWISVELPVPVAPDIIGIALQGNGIMLSWDAVNLDTNGQTIGISGYRVEGSDDPCSTNGWSAVATVSGTSYTDNGVTTAHRYRFYRVVALP